MRRALCLGLLAAACSPSGNGGGEGMVAAGTPAAGGLQVAVASVDLYVGEPQRFLVGLPYADGRLVSFGTVEMAFGFAGTAEAPVEPEPGPAATATYIPTPGTPEDGSATPMPTDPSEGRGVYQASGVVFDEAGFWQVEVTADIAGAGKQSATAFFQVNEEPSLPAPGRPALPTDNLTMRSKGVPLGAIDSRADLDGEVPDTELHEWTIRRAIEEGRPALVVFATPVYCVSRFCGPVTEMVEGLAADHADRAAFIHVEVWRDFQAQELNDAAVEWLYRDGDLTEPWLYLIGADGIILDRWSGLWSREEVVAALESLPPPEGE